MCWRRSGVWGGRSERGRRLGAVDGFVVAFLGAGEGRLVGRLRGKRWWDRGSLRCVLRVW